MELTQVAIVVVSQGNNPRILNPDFLAHNGIVPGGWKPTNVIVLPPMAAVSYENGVQVTLEGEKVLLQVNIPDQFDWTVRRQII